MTTTIRRRTPPPAPSPVAASWQHEDSTDLHQLAANLTGWLVWGSNSAPHWHAAPGPAGGSIADAIARGHVITATTATALRDACAARYGWDAVCVACNVLARECGHQLRPA
jgi:hypothetical protein